jgi:hypothetical protein
LAKTDLLPIVAKYVNPVVQNEKSNPYLSLTGILDYKQTGTNKFDLLLQFSNTNPNKPYVNEKTYLEFRSFTFDKDLNDNWVVSKGDKIYNVPAGRVWHYNTSRRLGMNDVSSLTDNRVQLHLYGNTDLNRDLAVRRIAGDNRKRITFDPSASMCIDVNEGNFTVGNPVTQYTCSQTDNQEWDYDNTGRFRSTKYPDYCISRSTDLSGKSYTMLDKCNADSMDQVWLWNSYDK